MQRTIIRAVLVGIVAGLIVGVYHNVFTVPIIERAIALEEERAAAQLPEGTQTEQEPPLVSLGVQRIGMAVGMGILGAVFGLMFAGTYGLLRWALPAFRTDCYGDCRRPAGVLGAIVPCFGEIPVRAARCEQREFAGLPAGLPTAVLHLVRAWRRRGNTGAE